MTVKQKIESAILASEGMYAKVDNQRLYLGRYMTMKGMLLATKASKSSIYRAVKQLQADFAITNRKHSSTFNILV